MPLIINDDEIELLHAIFNDWGSDCPSTDYDAVRALAERLGFWQPKAPPTEEELAERERFRNSPFSIKMSEIFKQSNLAMELLLKDMRTDITFVQSLQFPIGTQLLKIRLPDGTINKVKENDNDDSKSSGS